MALLFRPTQLGDIDAVFSVRERTRENPISRERLAQIGITPASAAAGLESGDVVGWVAEHESSVVGFCSGDTGSGEVLVLAVLPEFEGMGIGRRLLAHVADGLRARGRRRLWLAASADAASRAHGFYRAQGWRPNGQIDAQGDEVLVLEMG